MTRDALATHSSFTAFALVRTHASLRYAARDAIDDDAGRAHAHRRARCHR